MRCCLPALAVLGSLDHWKIGWVRRENTFPGILIPIRGTLRELYSIVWQLPSAAKWFRGSKKVTSQRLNEGVPKQAAHFISAEELFVRALCALEAFLLALFLWLLLDVAPAISFEG